VLSEALDTEATADDLVVTPDFRAIVQSLDLAIAVARTEDWRIVFENARFFQWFPPVVEEADTLVRRLPGFKPDRVATRLVDGRPVTIESEAASEGRERPLRIQVRRLEQASDAFALVQCFDVSKEKEVQYMLDSYSRLAERNARDLEKEKERVERLLLNIMPRTVLEELKDYGTTTPARFDDATMLLLDFVGFTSMAISSDPGAVIAELNDIFSAFDRITEMFNCERIKTIGDAYMAVSGVPEPAPDHAHNVARVALRLRRYLEKRNAAHPQEWRARIGVNTGPVIGSLVGIQKYVYDLFGPGVNMTARMEQLSEPMRITCSESTYELIKDDFVLSEVGEFDVKGFGVQRLYQLEDEIKRRF
jgi:adenylate cyclase